MSDTSTSGDSDDLEALFDSIAASGAGATPPPAPAAPPPPKPTLMQQVREGGDSTNDSDDLQALFDSIASQGASQPAEAGTAGPVGDAGEEWQGQDKVFQRVGQMARQLHDTLCDLGYEKLVENTVSAIPDARDRLAYIANLTEQAACRVLNATDLANPLQDEIENGAARLAAGWDALYANKIGVDDFKKLAAETRDFLKRDIPQKTSATKSQLLEIMMAQDFQDLTGDRKSTRLNSSHH